MAPEIWSMDSYNEKVDIWSIGVVTYYLLVFRYSGYQVNTLLLEIIRSNCWRKFVIRKLLSNKKFGNKLAEEVNSFTCSNCIPKRSVAKKQRNKTFSNRSPTQYLVLWFYSKNGGDWGRCESGRSSDQHSQVKSKGQAHP